MDKFAQMQDTISSPARTAFAIAPHDATPLARLPKALFIGTGGTLTVRLADDSNDTVFKNVGDGQILDIRVLYVRSSGTTATDIVGLS